MRVLIVVTKYGYPQNPEPTPEIFPQGPAYVAGALKAAGHEVFGVNNAYRYSTVAAPVALRLALAKGIQKAQPDVIALGALTADYLFIRDAVKFCRELAPNTPVVLGGGIVSGDPSFIFNDIRPDFAIHGEAEVAIVELLDALQGKTMLTDIAGLIYWDNGEAKHNPLIQKTRAAKLGSKYPLPYYEPLGIREFFRASSHRNAWHLASFGTWPRMLPVSAARSCPYACTFCFHSSGTVYKQRPISEVLEEAAYFHGMYDYNILVIYDELFSIKPQRVFEFCEGLMQLKLPIHWTCSLRVPDITPDMLKAMKASGCKLVGVGIESADDRILHSMKKKITRAQVERAIALCREVDVAIQGNMIFGDPAETEETMDVTTNFTKHYADHCITMNPMTPYPGTPVYDLCVEKKIVTDKKAYYEMLHRERVFNVTEIPDEVFRAKVREALAWNKAIRKRARVNPEIFVCSDAQAVEKWERPRYNFISELTCPNCSAQVDLNLDYSAPSGDTKALRAFLAQEHFSLCGACGRLMVAVFSMKASHFVFISIKQDTTPTYHDLQQWQREKAAVPA